MSKTENTEAKSVQKSRADMFGKRLTVSERGPRKPSGKVQERVDAIASKVKKGAPLLLLPTHSKVERNDKTGALLKTKSKVWEASEEVKALSKVHDTLTFDELTPAQIKQAAKVYCEKNGGTFSVVDGAVGVMCK